MSVGGASERDATETTVQPRRASPSPQATIATPEANNRIALRKAPLSAWRTRRSLTRAPRVSPKPERTWVTPLRVRFDSPAPNCQEAGCVVNWARADGLSRNGRPGVNSLR